ncbi:hypothetical protein HK097_008453 [Rhizophlyctis rosea]|uniref:Uncharacterized protein n=1 Tax=Rhizophlyctis rosea TaxID=64517 RepID=A0AAD5SM59_9FUNG|nr:hypothetical protein HK097_008453 [Rhizophlyctis rosea]
MATPKQNSVATLGLEKLSVGSGLEDADSIASDHSVTRPSSTSRHSTSSRTDQSQATLQNDDNKSSISRPSHLSEESERGSSVSNLFRRTKNKSMNSFSRSAGAFGDGRDDDERSIASGMSATLQALEEYEKRIESLLPSAAKVEVQPAKPDRRTQAMERTVRKMLDGARGLELRERKKMMKSYMFAFTGSDFVDWTLRHCNFFIKEEGIRYGAMLLQEGYICGVEPDQKFAADSSIWIFQTSAFMPGRGWTPTDRDYAIYLLKRDMRATSRWALIGEEIERLKRLHKNFHDEWKRIDREAEEAFKLQIWRIKCGGRVLNGRSQANQSVIQEEKRLKSNRSKQEEFERSLDKWELEDYLKKQNESLNYALNIARVKVSTAAESLVNFAEVMRPLDPLVEREAWAQNPWIAEYSIMMQLERDEATPNEIRVWTLSFAELLKDPVGIRAFRKFVKSEFSQENLSFWIKCQTLDDIDTRKEFFDKSMKIYEEFIKVGGSKELNLNTLTRKEVIARVEVANGDPRKLSYDWYVPAMEHVYQLMAKDSYVRFCKTDLVQNAVREARASSVGASRTSLEMKEAGKKKSGLTPSRESSAREII